MKQKLSKIAKSRLQQGSRGANSVATISESAYEIYFVLARSKGIPFGVKASGLMSSSGRWMSRKCCSGSVAQGCLKMESHCPVQIQW